MRAGLATVPGPSGDWPRRRRALFVVVAVLAAHLALGSAWRRPEVAEAAAPRRAPLVTRQIVSVAPVQADRAQAPATARPRRVGPAPPSLVEPAPAPASVGATLAASGPDVPTYANRPPPPVRLEFELRLGARAGEAVLHWQPDDAGYRLSLEGSVTGRPWLRWISTGQLDAHGLAPERFTDRRRRRGEQAVNFERAEGRIRYSGPVIEHALPSGAQDRLSWTMQLAAIVQADPAHREPGARLTLFVSGARGDADLWVFEVAGREDLELPAGRVSEALHLVRLPRHAYDTHAEAWLDPARGHLPVRLRLAAPDGGPGMEMRLR